MQYGSTAYLEKTLVISAHFLFNFCIWCGDMTKRDRKSQKNTITP